MEEISKNEFLSVMEQSKQTACAELCIDGEMYGELLKMAIDDSEEDIAKLEEAIESENYEQVARLGHSAKGVFSNVRITRLADLAKDIENIGKEVKDQQALKEKFEKFKVYYNEVKNFA